MNNIPVNLSYLFGTLRDSKHGNKLFNILDNIGMGRDEPITRDELAGLICNMLGNISDHIEESCEEKDEKIYKLEETIGDLEMKVDHLDEYDEEKDAKIEDLEETVARLTESKSKLIELCLEHGLIEPFSD